MSKVIEHIEDGELIPVGTVCVNADIPIDLFDINLTVKAGPIEDQIEALANRIRDSVVSSLNRIISRRRLSDGFSIVLPASIHIPSSRCYGEIRRYETQIEYNKKLKARIKGVHTRREAIRKKREADLETLKALAEKHGATIVLP